MSILPNLRTATSELRGLLRGLAPTGVRGFEGLIAALLSELTGSRFFVAGAGRQEGRDASTGGFGETQLAAEAKRYGGRTRLNERELLGELHQCVEALAPDCWILATSRPVPERLATSLSNAGRRLGVFVEVLESSEEAGDLDLLCAAYPHTVARWFADRDLRFLERIGAWPETTGRIETLRSRFSSEIGLVQVAEAVRERHSVAFRSEAFSRTLFGQKLDVLAGESRFVSRDGPQAELSSWFSTWRERPRPFVLLGEEGVGKSWVLARWIAKMAEERELPLVAFISSRDVRQEDPLRLVARMLCKRLAGHESDHSLWERRIANWLRRAPPSTPVMLLVIDGVNEAPSFGWRQFLEPLQSDPWRDRCALMLTSRPAFWNEKMLRPFEETYLLEPFSTSEQSTALKERGHSLREFPEAMLELMRKPRVFDMALRRKDELQAGGEFTIERLLFEDWRNRMAKDSSIGMTASQFREFLLEAADSHRSGGTRFSRKRIEGLMPTSIAERDREEIVSGNFLTRAEEPLERFEITPVWLSYGLGLALEQQVLSTQTISETREMLASFCEPYSGLEQLGEILASSLFFALLDGRSAFHHRSAILEYWLQVQNHSLAAVERLQAYVPEVIEECLQVLEVGILEGRLSPRAVDRIEHAILYWREEPKVADALLTSVTSWLGMIDPRGLSIMRSTRDQEERLAADIAVRAGGNLVAGDVLVLGNEAPLKVVDSDSYAPGDVLQKETGSTPILRHGRRGPQEDLPIEAAAVGRGLRRRDILSKLSQRQKSNHLLETTDLS